MAIFGYTRVSTEGQFVDNQRLEIERSGFVCDYWFDDVGVSGARQASERPAWQKLLGQIRDGETVVVSKLDRLGRDALDVQQTVKALQARDIRVLVLALGGLDLTSASGKLMLTMLSAVAEMERDLLIERTKAGQERARKEGVKFGAPVKICEEERVKVRKLLADGVSISEVSRRYGVSRGTIINIRKG